MMCRGSVNVVLVLALFAAGAEGHTLRKSRRGSAKMSAGTLEYARTGHVKLDVGLGAFEKNVSDAIVNGPLSSGNLSKLQGFDDVTRKELVNHTLTRLHQSFVTVMTPLKKAIGQGWMKMPEDGKDAFVESLKGSFSGVFDRMVTSFPSNGMIMMNALKEFPAKSLTLTHAENAMFSGFNKTVYRTEKTLAGYVDMDTKTAEFMGGVPISMIQVV